MFQTGLFSSGLLSLAVYLLQSYAIYRVCVVRGLPNPFFAFIPFLQLYMLGMIGDSLKYRSRQIDNLLGRIPLSYALPLISIAGSILRYPLSLMASLLISIGTVIVYYLIFVQYAPKSHLLFTVIACLPTFAIILNILTVLPIVGKIFALVSGIISLATILTQVAGPLLILYSLKGYRNYR